MAVVSYKYQNDPNAFKKHKRYVEESKKWRNAGTAVGLMNEAKDLMDKKDDYLLQYKDHPEHEKLLQAFSELPTAYNLWVQEVIGTPLMEKRPINPYVAAAIGNGIAGVGGGIIAGVNAQKQMDLYNEHLQQFNENLAKIKNKGQKVAFLVDEIRSVVGAEEDYNDAKRVITDETDRYPNEIAHAINLLTRLGDYKDSVELIAMGKKRLQEMNSKKFL